MKLKFLFLIYLIGFFFSSNSQSIICSENLQLLNQPSFVRIGDLDISGNKITVEAIINRTAPWSGPDVFQGDVVSKHEDYNDCNYLLRPSSAEITTSNGYFKTPVICPIQLNTTYHIAMVYDGSWLKFYRNGYLLSEVAASGNLIQNDWQTQIGLYFGQITQENFIGYINEVKIWKIARSQSEIQNYMFEKLPSPQSIPGLIAYYSFNDLKNKQGNAQWDATLHGSATIKNINPDCNLFSFPKPTQTFNLCEGKQIKIGINNNGNSFLWNTGETTDSIIINKPGFYWIESNTSGCKIRDSFIVENKANPIVSLPAETGICESGSIILDAGNIGRNFLWQNGMNTQTITISSPGIYHVQVSDQNCSTSDTVKVIRYSNPDFDVQLAASICKGEKVIPTLRANENYLFSWTPSNGLSNATMSTPEISPSSTTQYIIKATNSQGCIAHDTVKINVFENPVISVSPDTTICANGTIQLLALGATSYQWMPTQSLSNPSINNPIASPLSTTTYHVIATNINKCESHDSIRVAVRSPIEFIKPVDEAICEGDTIQLRGNENLNHKWLPEHSLSNPYAVNPYAFPNKTTIYTVVIEDPICKIDSTFTVNLLVRNNPSIKVEKSNDIDCASRSVQLFANGALSYSWFPKNHLDNPEIFNPISFPDSTSTYTVKGVDEFGCFDTAKITIEVSQNGKLLALLPNAFTPNNDGKNDCFGIKKWGLVTDLEFSVFNRWGELVFYSNKPENCWDGNFKGRLQPTDVYVYLVKATTNCGKIFNKGTVTLIR